jgi:hypothetical protein
MPNGNSFYCPGPYSRLGMQFAYESYVTTAGGQWPAYSPQWQTTGTTVGPKVRSGYGYYPQTGKFVGAGPASGYMVAKKSTDISPVRPMLTDIIYEWTQITHRTGTTPSAINIVWGDGHASTCTSPAVLNPDPIIGTPTPAWATVRASRATTRIFSTSWRQSSLDKFISLAATFPMKNAMRFSMS